MLCKSKTTIEEFVEVQRIIADTLSDDEWNPLLGWVGNSEENCIEFELITKVYDRSDVSDKMVFNSLLENNDYIKSIDFVFPNGSLHSFYHQEREKNSIQLCTGGQLHYCPAQPLTVPCGCNGKQRCRLQRCRSLPP